MTTPVDPKQLTINIPVYVSELIEERTDLFGPSTYQKMVTGIKDKIDRHNITAEPIKISRKNKVSEKAIEDISPTELEVLGRKSLLIRYTSYTTNYSDGFFEKESRVDLTKDAKFGSVNHFMLLCPYIKTGEFSTVSHWIILIYEDPNKESADIISTAKILLNKVLNIKVKNIKLNSAIQTIKSAGIIENAIIRITTVDTDPDNEDVLFKTHLVGSRTTIISESQYKNLPPENAVSLIDIKGEMRNYYRAVKKLFLSEKREIKITQVFKEENNNSITQTVEEIYNTTTLITEHELENCLYGDIFVLEKLTPVLKEYLSQVNER